MTETILKLGTNYPKRKSKYPDYYKPLFGTDDCTYKGKKKGRKTNEQKQAELEATRFRVKKHSPEIVLDFD